MTRDDADRPESAHARKAGVPEFSADSGRLEFSRMSIDDLSAVLEYEQQLFGNDAWSESVFVSELADSSREYYLARLRTPETVVVGYLGIMWFQQDADVQTVGVLPEFQGRGYGRELMVFLLRRVRELGVTNVLLEVREDNLVARNLYAALGFRDIAVRPRYYQPDDVDAIVMQWRFSEVGAVGVE